MATETCFVGTGTTLRQHYMKILTAVSLVGAVLSLSGLVGSRDSKKLGSMNTKCCGAALLPLQNRSIRTSGYKAIGFDKSMTYLKGNTTDCQEMFLLKAAHVLCAITLLFISLQIYHVNL
jgi:hypothetical protein